MLMFLTYTIKYLLLIIYVMLMVAFYTILERKIIAYIQRRAGPNFKPLGLLQAIADGLKLLVKKTIIPQTANSMIFIVGPLITFNLSYLGWCIISSDKIMNTILLLLKSVFELTIQDILFIILYILVFSFIIFNSYNKELHFYKKVHFRILGILFGIYLSATFWPENFFNLPKNIVVGFKVILVISFVFMNKFDSLTQEQDTHEISFNGLYPVVRFVKAYCLHASNFIIFLQPVPEISEFEFIIGEETKKFYPLFKSPCLIYQYAVIGYALKTDIKNLNIRYITCTSYADKIKDFNKIFLHLIQHFQKKSDKQDENVRKLTAFMKNLENKNSEIFDVFNLENYLQFIYDNHHLISEILEFWESLNLNNIEDCKDAKNINFKLIEILECFIRINPFLINSLNLRKDKKKLGEILYSFFDPYMDLKNFQNTSIDLDQYNILLMFHHCALNQENLNLEKFQNNLIEILKNSK